MQAAKMDFIRFVKLAEIRKKIREGDKIWR